MNQFVNFTTHPTNPSYQLYYFVNQEQAAHFKNLLNTNTIPFEEHFDEDEERYYFAIKKRYDKQTRNFNFITIGQFRKPFISNPILKWIIVIVPIAVILLAIIGYLKS